MTHPDDRKPNSQSPECFDEDFGMLLCAYLDDELAPTERLEVEARLKSDPTARAQLDALTMASNTMRNLPRGSAPASIVEDLTAQSERAELLGKPEESVTLARHKRGPFRTTMAVAAMLMVAVSASLYVSLKGQQDSGLNRRIERSDVPLTSKNAPTRESMPSKESMLAKRDDSTKRGRELFENSTNEMFLNDGEAARSKGATSDESNARSSAAQGGLRQEESGTFDSASSGGNGKGEPTGQVIRESKSKSATAPGHEHSRFDGKGPSLAQKDHRSLSKDVAKPESQVRTPDPQSKTEASDAITNLNSPMAKTPDSRPTQLAELDPEMTFEQKLIAGADATAVAHHAFDNEPLQLSVSFENDLEQAAGEKQLLAFLGRNCVRSIPTQIEGDNDSSAAAKDENRYRDSERSSSEPLEPFDLDDEAFYVGLENQNYEATSNSRQYLVRIKSTSLGEVVNDLTTIGAEEVQLRVGNVRSENPEQLWQLAGQAAGEEFERPVPPRAQSKPNDRMAINRKKQLPESAQWIQALQFYGLMPREDADDSRFEGKASGKQGADRGGFAGGAGVGRAISTNGAPNESNPGSKDVIKTQQQTLLTLVIELVNDHAPGKKEKPTKIKQ